jgi:hypothetical protein
MWGCKTHWFRLPKKIRDEIWRTYVPGQEITKTPSRDYLKAADAAEHWIRQNSTYSKSPSDPATSKGEAINTLCRAMRKADPTRFSALAVYGLLQLLELGDASKAKALWLEKYLAAVEQALAPSGSSLAEICRNLSPEKRSKQPAQQGQLFPQGQIHP